MNYFLSRPTEFLDCESLADHKGNKTAKDEAGHGCAKVKKKKKTNTPSLTNIKINNSFFSL